MDELGPRIHDSPALDGGILADDQEIINEAILHFKQGRGTWLHNAQRRGRRHDDPSGTGEKLAQGNESGRDQGHNVLCAAMVGAFCQMAYNIGDDLFAFEDGRAIAFAQYIAKYNLVKSEVGPDYEGNLTDASFRYPESSMPFTTYTCSGWEMTKYPTPDEVTDVRAGISGPVTARATA